MNTKDKMDVAPILKVKVGEKLKQIQFFNHPDDAIWTKHDYRSFSDALWSKWVFMSSERNKGVFPDYKNEEVVRGEIYRMTAELIEIKDVPRMDIIPGEFNYDLPCQHCLGIGGVYFSLANNSFINDEWHLTCPPFFDHKWMGRDLEKAKKEVVDLVKPIIKRQYNHFFPQSIESITLTEYRIKQQKGSELLREKLYNESLRAIEQRFEWEPIKLDIPSKLTISTFY